MRTIEQKQDFDHLSESSSEIVTVVEKPIPMTTKINASDDSQSDEDSEGSSGFNDSETRLFIITVIEPYFEMHLTQKIFIENLEEIQNLVEKIAGYKVKLNPNKCVHRFSRKSKKSKHKKKETREHYDGINNNPHSQSNRTESITKSEEGHLRSLNSSRLELPKSCQSNSNICSDSVDLCNYDDQPSPSSRNAEMETVPNINNLLATCGEMDNGDLDYLEENMNDMELSLEDLSYQTERDECSCTSRVPISTQVDRVPNMEQEIKWELELHLSDDGELMNRTSNCLSETVLPKTVKYEPVQNPHPANSVTDDVLAHVDATSATSLLVPKSEVTDEPVEEEAKVDKQVDPVTLSAVGDAIKTLLIDPKLEVKDEPAEEEPKVDKEVELMTLSDMDIPTETPPIDPKPAVKDKPVEQVSKVEKEVVDLTLRDMDDAINIPLIDLEPGVKNKPVEKDSNVHKELMTLSDIDGKPEVKDELVERESRVAKDVKLVTFIDLDEVIKAPLIDLTPAVKDEPVEQCSTNPSEVKSEPVEKCSKTPAEVKDEPVGRESRVDKDVELATLSVVDDTIKTTLIHPKPEVKDETVDVEIVTSSKKDDATKVSFFDLKPEVEDESLNKKSKVDNEVVTLDAMDDIITTPSIDPENSTLDNVELVTIFSDDDDDDDEKLNVDSKKKSKIESKEAEDKEVETAASSASPKHPLALGSNEESIKLIRREKRKNPTNNEEGDEIQNRKTLKYSEENPQDCAVTKRLSESYSPSDESNNGRGKTISIEENSCKRNSDESDEINKETHKSSDENPSDNQCKNDRATAERMQDPCSMIFENHNTIEDQINNLHEDKHAHRETLCDYKKSNDHESLKNEKIFIEQNKSTGENHFESKAEKLNNRVVEINVKAPKTPKHKHKHRSDCSSHKRDCRTISEKGARNIENINEPVSRKRASRIYENSSESRNEPNPRKKSKKSTSESTAKSNNHSSHKVDGKNLSNREKLPRLQVEVVEKPQSQHQENRTVEQSEETCGLNKHYKTQKNIDELSEQILEGFLSMDEINEAILHAQMSYIHYGCPPEGEIANSTTPIANSEKERPDKNANNNLNSQENTFAKVGICADVESPLKSILSESNKRCMANDEDKSNDYDILAPSKKQFTEDMSEIHKSSDVSKKSLPKATSTDSFKNMHSDTTSPCYVSLSRCKIQASKTLSTDNEEDLNNQKVAFTNGNHVTEVNAESCQSLDSKDTSPTSGPSPETSRSTHATMTRSYHDFDSKPTASFIGRIPKRSAIQSGGMKSFRSSNDDERRHSDSDEIHTNRSPLIEPDQNKEQCESRIKVDGKAMHYINQLPRLIPSANNAPSVNNCRKWNLFLQRILEWNPIWLKKKSFRNVTQKIARKKTLASMQPTYETYDKYYSDAEDLLALNIWYNMTSQKEMDAMLEKGKTKFSIASYSVLNRTVAGMEIKQTKMSLHVVVGKRNNARHTFPSVGDLVFFDYSPNQERQNGEIDRRHESIVFAYVETVRKKMLPSETPYFTRDLLEFVANPDYLLVFEVITKPIASGIERGTISEMQTLPYFNKNIRTIQALHHLRVSPLLSMVLHPKAEDYQLQPAKHQQHFPMAENNDLDENQKDVITRISEAILEGKPKICLVHGSPGTGKTKVIVNLLAQLYREGQYKKSPSFRILVCAQTNSAVDEIVTNMLELRKFYDPAERLKLVRTGRSEMMQENVKKVSLSSLANKELRRFIASRQSSNPEKAERTISFLREQIIELRKKKKTATNANMVQHISRKILDCETKYHACGKLHKNEILDSKEKDALEKAMENTILEGAHVIACTLVGCSPRYMESIFDGENNAITVCIIDNATQSSEAETLLPLLLGVKTLVLVGGSHQEPPRSLVSRNKNIAGLNQSFFSRVQKLLETQSRNPIIELDKQYRMALDVAEWPEKYFYGSPFRNLAISTPLSLHSYKVFDLDSVQDGGDPFINKFEGLFVTTILYTIATFVELIDKTMPLRIGVLTVTRPQKMWIESQIEARLDRMPTDRRNKVIIDVNTIDYFHGQERDVMILSCTKTQDIGRLADEQILCFALTRAKHCMILCGHFDAYESNPMWKDLLSDAKYRGVYSNLKWDIDAVQMQRHIMR